MKLLTKGHKSILDPSFTYVHSSATDIRHTFIRALAARLAAPRITDPKIVPLFKGKSR